MNVEARPQYEQWYSVDSTTNNASTVFDCNSRDENLRIDGILLNLLSSDIQS
jgi:hypothetical protein